MMFLRFPSLSSTFFFLAHISIWHTEDVLVQASSLPKTFAEQNREHREALGLSSEDGELNAAKIKAAYRERVMNAHPDKQGKAGTSDDSVEFRRVQDAKEFLSAALQAGTVNDIFDDARGSGAQHRFSASSRMPPAGSYFSTFTNSRGFFSSPSGRASYDFSVNATKCAETKTKADRVQTALDRFDGSPETDREVVESFAALMFWLGDTRRTHEEAVARVFKSFMWFGVHHGLPHNYTFKHSTNEQETVDIEPGRGPRVSQPERGNSRTVYRRTRQLFLDEADLNLMFRSDPGTQENERAERVAPSVEFQAASVEKVRFCSKSFRPRAWRR